MNDHQADAPPPRAPESSPERPETAGPLADQTTPAPPTSAARSLLRAAVNAAGLVERVGLADWQLADLLADTWQGRVLLERVTAAPPHPLEDEAVALGIHADTEAIRLASPADWDEDRDPPVREGEHNPVAARCRHACCSHGHAVACGAREPEYDVACNRRNGHRGDHEHDAGETGVTWAQEDQDPRWASYGNTWQSRARRLADRVQVLEKDRDGLEAKLGDALAECADLRRTLDTYVRGARGATAANEKLREDRDEWRARHDAVVEYAHQTRGRLEKRDARAAEADVLIDHQRIALVRAERERDELEQLLTEYRADAAAVCGARTADGTASCALLGDHPGPHTSVATVWR